MRKGENVSVDEDSNEERSDLILFNILPSLSICLLLFLSPFIYQPAVHLMRVFVRGVELPWLAPANAC